MEIDWSSFAIGTATIFIFMIVGVLIVLNLILGKAKDQIKYVLRKLYSTTSLMMIAIFDVVVAFDPSQHLLGLGIAPLAGITIFLLEWGWHEKFAKQKMPIAVVQGLIAAILIAIPTPIAGVFVAWFGVAGSGKTKGKTKND